MRTILKSTLCALMLLQAPMGYAKQGEADSGASGAEAAAAPSVPEGVDLEAIEVAENGSVGELPPKLQALALEKAADQERAPGWVKQLWHRKVGSYFANGKSQNAELERDAVQLHEHYEQKSDGKDTADAGAHLKTFIRSLSPRAVYSRIRHGRIVRPMAELTVEELVVTKQLTYLGKKPNFVKQALGYVTGPHLFQASHIAARVVVAAALGYSVIYFGGGPFMAGMLIGAIQAGPLAAIVNSLTSWGLQPTNEFIRVLNNRYTGGLEQRINNFFDKLKPLGAEPAAHEVTKNNRPRTADLKQDGMNFAYMTPEDQKANWEKNLRVWVAVAKRFGQLLRDTHHHGRVLMMVAWSDEQNSAQLVETMDLKLVNLNIEAEMLMTPMKTAYLVRGETERKDRMIALFDEYQTLCELAWISPNRILSN